MFSHIIIITLCLLVLFFGLLVVVFLYVKPVQPIDVTGDKNQEKKEKKTRIKVGDKTKGWFWFAVKIALIWIAVAWFFDLPWNPKAVKDNFIGNFRAAIVKDSRSEYSAVDYGDCISFSERETQKIVELVPNKWTEWIKTPPNTDWRFDSQCDLKINFWDGEVVDCSKKVFQFGVMRGIFRFLSENEGKVVITVSPQSS